MKNFTSHTISLNPDADLDGQNDYNDPVPLDYDMDGDRKINSRSLVTVGDPCYVERLATAANNDPNLIKGASGNFVEDEDIDNDTVNNIADLDMDADGMSDEYEVKYGSCNIADFIVDGGVHVHNEVGGQGWQHPMIYNARYALVLGGSIDVACINDAVEMSNKLKDYNYLDENIYCYVADKDVDYGNCNDGWAEMKNITYALREIGIKITKNDFFYFAEVSHGGGYPSENDGRFDVYGGSFRFGPIVETEEPPLKSLSIQFNSNIKVYARSLFVMSSCGCGYVINQLHGENRIIITAATPSDWINAGPEGDVWKQIDDNNHFAFLHQGTHLIYHVFWWEHVPYPGFIPELGSSSGPQSILHAYDKGYEAATNNYQDWPQEHYDTSHPQIDADGNGTPMESSDRSIAYATWL